MALTDGHLLLSTWLLLSLYVAAGEWSFFKLCQEWPPAVCVKENTKKVQCRIPKNVTTWSIHGLWPTDYSQKIRNCDPSLHFNYTQIVSLVPNLTLYWPNLHFKSKFDSFWSHEWSAHGTCCQDFPATRGEMNYFSAALQQRQKFDIKKILSKATIIPSKSKLYYHDNFTQAIKQTTQYEPIVICKSGQKHHLIYQLEICLSKDFKTISCLRDMRAFKESNSTSLKFNEGHSMYSLTKDPVYVMYWNDGWKSTNCPKNGFYYPPIMND